jgi:hypothetical protein
LPARQDQLLTNEHVGSGDGYYIVMDTRNANERKNPHIDDGSGFNTYAGGNITSSIAAARLNGTQWQFDPNGSWTDFTPDENFCIIGKYNTSATDNISEAEIYYNATPCDIDFTGSVGTTPAYVNPSTGGVTSINGNMISTGVINSTNFSESAGTQLDLNNGKFIIGGSTNQRIEIDGSTAELKFFTGSATPVIELDDNLISSHPGMLMQNGTLRIIESRDFGNIADAAPLYVEANKQDHTTNRVAGFFGIGAKDTTNARTSFGTGFITGKSACTATVTRPYLAGVYAESNLDFCPANADQMILCSYIADVEVNAGAAGYSFYGINGDIYTNGEIQASGDVIAYFSSDAKMKDNIVPIDNPLNKIKQIRGVYFDWNEQGPSWTKGWVGQVEGKKHDVGVIAQEIQKVLPEVVMERTNPTIDSDETYLAVDYKKIVPLLIEGIKEQQTMIDDLQDQINKLKEK